LIQLEKMAVSKLNVLKIFLLLIVPALLSSNAVIAKNQAEIIGWMKCWVTFALVLVLELLLTYRLKGKIMETLKIGILIWCLAPVRYNGSDVIFDYYVAPLHWLVVKGAEFTSPVMSVAVASLSNFVKCASYHLASIISSSADVLSAYFSILIEKLIGVCQELPGMASTLAKATGDLLHTCGEYVYSAAVLTGVYLYSAAVHLYSALSTAVQLMISTMLSITSYYKENQRNPRLISTMVQQMIFK